LLCIKPLQMVPLLGDSRFHPNQSESDEMVKHGGRCAR
jgi:hypothetical protein